MAQDQDAGIERRTAGGAGGVARDAASAYAHLAGHRLPGGRITLTPHVAWLWADCVTAPPSREVGHPSTGWLLAMKRLGVTLEELFALVDATPDDGVVLGEAELELRRVLRVGTVYDAEASIVDVVRKEGRRTGTFDRMRLRVQLREVDGGAVAFVLVNTMVFPRPVVA